MIYRATNGDKSEARNRKEWVVSSFGMEFLSSKYSFFYAEKKTSMYQL